MTSNPYQAYFNLNQSMNTFNMNVNSMNMNINFYNPTFCPEYAYNPQMQSYLNSYMHSNIVSEDSDLYNIRRTSATNLVETRKTHSRQGNKYS